MTKKLITEIEFERQETLVVTQARRDGRPPCDACGGKQTMLTPEEAAAVMNLSLRGVFRLIETTEIHFTETPDGGIYLCANTLCSQTLETTQLSAPCGQSESQE